MTRNKRIGTYHEDEFSPSEARTKHEENPAMGNSHSGIILYIYVRLIKR